MGLATISTLESLLIKQVDALTTQNLFLVAALEYYGNPDRWDEIDPKSPIGALGRVPSPNPARIALAKK